MNKAWIGLTKAEDNCDEGDGECRWRDWSWQDGTEYQYPAWYKWHAIYHPGGNLYAVCFPTLGWHGSFPSDSQKFAYVCEKGILM